MLFAGNGFNSLDTHYVSWTELIQRLFKKFGVYDSYIRLFVDEVSPFMQYEILAQSILDKNGKFDRKDDEEIRKEIASLTSESLECTVVHEKAVKTYDEIITMNYDSCFESAALSCGKINPPDVNDNLFQLKVDLEGRKTIEGCRAKRVWHPHGAVSENGSVESLCMWFQTYIQNVSEIKQHLYPAVTSENSYGREVYEMMEEIQSMGFYSGKINSWFQLFFTADVDIIGTDLSYSELDVWWVLSCRSKLIREGKLARDFNTIRFFMLKSYEGETMSKDKIAKIALLKSMNIEIVLVRPEDYFGENEIFISRQNNLSMNEIAPLPVRSDLYNTEWYYLKAMGME